MLRMREPMKNAVGVFKSFRINNNMKLLCAGMALGMIGFVSCGSGDAPAEPEASFPQVEIRGVYGGIPGAGNADEAKPLSDFGVNAVFLNSRGITGEAVADVHSQGARIFAEFNTLHQAEYLEDNPDASPVGRDGQVCPPAAGWQGICPTHPGYRAERMDEFRQLLKDFELDGVWIDYHQAHANWEMAEPVLPDTCFCERCRELFSSDTGIELPSGSAEDIAGFILDEHGEAWISWRNQVFTDWIRELREILDEERPDALLGYYHCPWTDQEFDGALLDKLAIDLRSQSQYIDVFSPLLYHAYLGRNGDVEWISSHVSWLGEYLGVKGYPGEKIRVWPIVQLADLGGDIPAEEVPAILEAGLQSPASGIMIFSWGRISEQAHKVEEMSRVFQGLRNDQR